MPKQQTTIRVKRLDPRAKLPTRGSDRSAGWDLYALDSGYIHHGQRIVVDTGLAMAIPAGWEGQVRPRSGIAAKYGVTIVNSPGTIDADYRGPVKLAIVNHGAEFSWLAGERLAQIVFKRAPEVSVVEVDELDETERGDGGFGSTGK